MQKGRSIKKLRNFLVSFLSLLIRLYQVCISPFFPQCCKYTPTCSCYALEAIKRHGAVKGSYLATRRILRCNPWSKGGYDPVP